MKLAEAVEQGQLDLSTVEFQYGIIYSVDACPEEITEPPEEQVKNGRWNRTESSTESDYGIEEWHHWKWCGLLDQKQFDEFIEHVFIRSDPTPTMGSLGAPTPDGDIHIGCSPAIAFNNDGIGGNCVQSAYVTPYVMDERVDTPFDEDDWEAMRDYLVERYK